MSVHDLHELREVPGQKRVVDRHPMQLHRHQLTKSGAGEERTSFNFSIRIPIGLKL